MSAGPAMYTRSKVQARAMAKQDVQRLFWGLAFSISSGVTAGHIQDEVMLTGWGMKDLTEATKGFTGKYPTYITEAIAGHAVSGLDHADLPIILTFDQSNQTDDPRVFNVDDYVIVYSNGVATPINTSAEHGFYRVKTVHDDNTLMVAPASTPAVELKSPQVFKTRCALLRKHNVDGIPRLIIMVLDDKSSIGGAKSSRRRKRRPSRSKSVNKKRKYTQQRVRRRSHRR